MTSLSILHAKQGNNIASLRAAIDEGALARFVSEFHETRAMGDIEPL